MIKVWYLGPIFGVAALAASAYWWDAEKLSLIHI